MIYFYALLRIDRQVRFCKYCLNLGIHLIEDEHHVLLICPLFNDIRQRYIAKHFRHFWPSDISFVNMMSSKSEIAIRDLAVFIYHVCLIYMQILTAPCNMKALIFKIIMLH